MSENRAMATAWTTRPETGANAAAIREVNLVAFSSEEEADLVDELRASVPPVQRLTTDWQATDNARFRVTDWNAFQAQGRRLLGLEELLGPEPYGPVTRKPLSDHTLVRSVDAGVTA